MIDADDSPVRTRGAEMRLRKTALIGVAALLVQGSALPANAAPSGEVGIAVFVQCPGRGVEVEGSVIGGPVLVQPIFDPGNPPQVVCAPDVEPGTTYMIRVVPDGGSLWGFFLVNYLPFYPGSTITMGGTPAQFGGGVGVVLNGQNTTANFCVSSLRQPSCYPNG
jgi:hypothetical protein